MPRGWNERDHPRHRKGTGRNAGRFRDKTGGGWAQRISDQIGRVVGSDAVADLGTDRGDNTRTVTMEQLRAAGDLIQPGMWEIQTAGGQWMPVESVQPWGQGVKVMYSGHNGQAVWEVARIKPAGAPVREFDSPAPRVGTPRGDGTYEITTAELLTHAAELEGRIQYHPRSDDGKRLLDPRPILFIVGHDRAVTIKEATNVGSMLLPDRLVVFSYLDEPTEAEQFFEMRLASGVESEETLEDLMAHSERYSGRFEVFDPTADGTPGSLAVGWDVLQSVEYDEDEFTGEDVIVVWVGEVGEEQRLQFPDDPSIKLRIRPIGGA